MVFHAFGVTVFLFTLLRLCAAGFCLIVSITSGSTATRPARRLILLGAGLDIFTTLGNVAIRILSAFFDSPDGVISIMNVWTPMSILLGALEILFFGLGFSRLLRMRSFPE